MEIDRDTAKLNYQLFETVHSSDRVWITLWSMFYEVGSPVLPLHKRC